MITPKVEINKQDVANLQKQLGHIKDGVPKAITRAINKTTITARKEAATAINQKINITKSDIKKSIKRYTAKYKRLSGDIWFPKIPQSLRRFGAKQTKKGVTYKTFKDGKRELLPHAFIIFPGQKPGVDGAEIKQGSKKGVVVTREGSASTPLHREVGPGLSELIRQKGIGVKMEHSTKRTLFKYLDAQVDVLLKRTS